MHACGCMHCACVYVHVCVCVCVCVYVHVYLRAHMGARAYVCVYGVCVFVCVCLYVCVTRCFLKVKDVRTNDDTLITVKLMVFYELTDTETMVCNYIW